jgi:hypothetical protein
MNVTFIRLAHSLKNMLTGAELFVNFSASFWGLSFLSELVWTDQDLMTGLTRQTAQC